MRKLLFLGVLVAAFAAAAPALTATATVSITRNDFTPSNISVKEGDTVTWRNTDTLAHQVVFKDVVAGCAQTLVVPPGGSASCTFAKAGKYEYDDPTGKKGMRGNVTVAAAPLSIALQVRPTLITYGQQATLTGTLSSQREGEALTVLAAPCGQGPSSIGTVTTTAGGAFTNVARPTLNTTYAIRYRNVDSSTFVVKVRPRIAFAKVALNRYSVRVTAATSLVGRYVTLLRFNATTRIWSPIKSVRLATLTLGTAPTKVSSVRFRAVVRAGVRLRIIMTQAQVGGCYAAGRSNILVN